MNTLRRGQFMHIAKVFFEEREDIGAGRVVWFDAHGLALVMGSFKRISRGFGLSILTR